MEDFWLKIRRKYNSTGLKIHKQFKNLCSLQLIYRRSLSEHRLRLTWFIENNFIDGRTWAECRSRETRLKFRRNKFVKLISSKRRILFKFHDPHRRFRVPILQRIASFIGFKVFVEHFCHSSDAINSSYRGENRGKLKNKGDV